MCKKAGKTSNRKVTAVGLVSYFKHNMPYSIIYCKKQGSSFVINWVKLHLRLDGCFAYVDWNKRWCAPYGHMWHCSTFGQVVFWKVWMNKIYYLLFLNSWCSDGSTAPIFPLLQCKKMILAAILIVMASCSWFLTESISYCEYE